MTFSQLMEFGSVEDAKEYIVEKEIEDVLRKSHVDQFAWLENKFDIKLRTDLAVWPTFVELTQRRNLFAHTNGVVSNQYLTECKKQGVKVDDVEIGQKLVTDGKYFRSSYSCIFEIGFKLAQVLWRKTNPNDIEKAEQSLIDTSYQLLLLRRYDFAVILLDFANTTIKSHVDEEHKRLLQINWAQAYKWKGDNKKCLEILSQADWSASSDRFKISVAVLQDDFDQAYFWMKRIGVGEGTAISERDYKDWPLFKEFRKSEVFLKTFEEVFKHPFTKVEVDTKPDESEEINADQEETKGRLEESD